jgi:ABC-type glycerol-3-phosphate transport system permease component
MYLLITYLITVIISYALFRLHFKLNKDDNSYGLAVVFMIIPFFNILQPIGLIIGFAIMKMFRNKKLSLKKFFGIK